MCDHCGCEGQAHSHDGHHHGDDHTHGHSRGIVDVETDVLVHNNAHAARLRAMLAERSARLVNLIGSPGCGKTELLSKLIPLLGVSCVVVEGDLATSNDAVRIRRTGAPVFQIETGTACHLSAADVAHALSHLPVEAGTLAIVENVGNLVCPAMFDIGESLRIVCLSVTEGADKPEKYPVSFREADAAVITKADLLPYVDFDLAQCRRLIADIHPGMPVFLSDAKTPTGLSDIVAHLRGLFET